jgi:hypothetical protein
MALPFIWMQIHQTPEYYQHGKKELNLLEKLHNYFHHMLKLLKYPMMVE